MMYKKLKTALLLTLCTLFSIGAAAQTQTISGKVTDVNGDALPGVNVSILGTTTGTATDYDGQFTLSAATGQSLEFTFVGYKTQVITVSGGFMSVTLHEDTESLEEVLVIGYGSVKKGDATGSVTAVKADLLNKGAITSASDLLKGKTAGVMVVPGSGMPGSDGTIRVRGGSSMSASNDPLIVIDGLPVGSNGINGAGGLLSSINPNEIETFTVLKDASATAIFGSRASNGVILITTKKASAGDGSSKMNITADVQASMAFNTKQVDVLTADELRAYMLELFGEDYAGYKALGTASTNWQDEVYQKAFTEEANIGLSQVVDGGSFALPYRVSLGFINQDGVLKTSNMKRGTLSLNMNPTFLDKALSVNLSAKGMYIHNRFANGDALGQAVQYDPTQEKFADDSEGGLHGYRIWRGADGAVNTMANQNPLALLAEKVDLSNVYRLLGSFQVDYKLPMGLRANLNLGIDYSTSNGTVDIAEGSEHSYHIVAQGGSGAHTDYDQIRNDQTLDFYLAYANSNPVHKFDVMVGYSWQHFFSQANSIQYKKSDPTFFLSESHTKSESFLVSFFGRLNYSFDDRYLLTVTVRDDGSSKFRQNPWGFFPSAALAWRVIEEDFMKDQDLFSNLKLRLGYGITGQQNVAGDYPSLATYYSSTNQSKYQLGDEVINPIKPQGYSGSLKWEETTTYNIGLDFGFAAGRISGAIDLYKRYTNDLINRVQVAAGSNLTNFATMNVGNLENEGFELTLDTKPVVSHDFNWDLGVNVAYNKNLITKMTVIDDPSYMGVVTGGISGGSGNNIKIHRNGYATNSFLVYQQVYDQEGKPIQGVYVDQNEDGIINDSDMRVYHKAAPDWIMGINTALYYKNFTLSLAGRAFIGNYMYNNMASNGEMYADLWTNNFVNNRLSSSTYTRFSQAQYFSDYYVQNASFFKLDNATLAYQVNDMIRVQLTGSNLLTITPYTGLDPEIESGIDNNMYPRPTTILFGATINL